VLLRGPAVEVVDEPTEVGAVAAGELRRLVDQRLPRLPAVADLAARLGRLDAPAQASPDRAVPRSSITACFTSGRSKKRAAPRTT
jgi:hypothetical protein